MNLQRGFVTVQADARLQVDAGAPSAALQPAEWQSIPRNLQRDLPAAAANLTYRLVEPSFQLPLRLERHEPARLLPARVNRITFDSVVADDGLALTRATLEILPGDKRLLSFTLPGEARFWFAFVNQSGVWPWREADRILIPLKRQSRADQPITVDLYYSARAGQTGTRSLDVKLLAPKFDLPLENLVWRVSLNDRWNVKGWGGALQLAEQTAAPTGALDLQTYLRDEEVLQQRRTLQAQEYLTQANSALEQGDPLQARRAFEDAYGLSVHDAAFNEDARVQLHNIKLQQALVGLNVRQAAAADDADKSGAGGKLRELRNRKEINYTQQDAKDILDRNSADENSAFLRLAERLIQQQDAAVSSAAALRANLPEQGRVLTFKRAVVVDSWADLDVAVHAVANRAAPLGIRGAILGGTLLVLTLLALAMRGLLQPRTQHFAQDQ